MRLWSIHPKYLDRIGLVALWREGLLAQKVLLGKTKGYTAHPQLSRFRACAQPVAAIGCYLKDIAEEADRRGYRFDASKIAQARPCRTMKVTQGQIDYEWQHLLKKLKTRDKALYKTHSSLSTPNPHPLFTPVPGGIEDWERL
ncbi:MAG: pyrimidine dimer DNA glycosylase/endonuclease V [Thermodesulfovibrionales bacterium]